MCIVERRKTPFSTINHQRRTRCVLVVVVLLLLLLLLLRVVVAVGVALAVQGMFFGLHEMRFRHALTFQRFESPVHEAHVRT